MKGQENIVYKINSGKFSKWLIISSVASLLLFFALWFTNLFFSAGIDNRHQKYYTKLTSSMEFSEYKSIVDSCNKDDLVITIDNNTVLSASCSK